MDGSNQYQTPIDMNNNNIIEIGINSYNLETELDTINTKTINLDSNG